MSNELRQQLVKSVIQQSRVTVNGQQVLKKMSMQQKFEIYILGDLVNTIKREDKEDSLQCIISACEKLGIDHN